MGSTANVESRAGDRHAVMDLGNFNAGIGLLLAEAITPADDPYEFWSPDGPDDNRGGEMADLPGPDHNPPGLGGVALGLGVDGRFLEIQQLDTAGMTTATA